MIDGKPKEVKIIYLHHSTGKCIWEGGIPEYIKTYNKKNDTNYNIQEQPFPKKTPYGWNNYPYDYWNIWVNNAGNNPFQDEPTLEILTKKYNVIVFKHCFPVSRIKQNNGKAKIDSDERTIEHYKLQYNALRKKLLQYPKTKFIIWTGAALNKRASNKEEGKRAREFFNWVKTIWNKEKKNIFIWDFFELETEGGSFLKDEYSEGKEDSHPNKEFSKKTAPLIAQKIIDVIEQEDD